MVESGSYIVFHIWQGETIAYVTLDKAKAIDYAQEKHGQWYKQFHEIVIDIPDGINTSDVVDISETIKVAT